MPGVIVSTWGQRTRKPDAKTITDTERETLPGHVVNGPADDKASEQSELPKSQPP